MFWIGGCAFVEDGEGVVLLYYILDETCIDFCYAVFVIGPKGWGGGRWGRDVSS